MTSNFFPLVSHIDKLITNNNIIYNIWIIIVLEKIYLWHSFVFDISNTLILI